MIQPENKRTKKRKCKKGRMSQNHASKEVNEHPLVPANHLKHGIEKQQQSGEDGLHPGGNQHCLICREVLSKSSSGHHHHTPEVPSTLVDHISANICKACQASINDKNQSPLLTSYLNGIKAAAAHSVYTSHATPEGNCHCASCPEKNSRLHNGKPPGGPDGMQHRAAWLELKQGLQMVYWREGLRIGESLLPYYLSSANQPPEPPCGPQLRQLVRRLCEADTQRLFQCLHNQVQVFVAEIRLRLLTHLVASSAPPLALRMLEEYAMLCSAAAKTAPFLAELDENHLRHFNLNWELVNRHLFYNLIFSDPFLFAGLPEVITHQRLGCVAPICPNECHQALKMFDDEMRNVSSFWQEMHSEQGNNKVQQWEANGHQGGRCGCLGCAEARLRRPSELWLLASKVGEDQGTSNCCCVTHSQECQHLSSQHLSPAGSVAAEGGGTAVVAAERCCQQHRADVHHHHHHHHHHHGNVDYPMAFNLEAESQDILQEQLCLMTYGDWESASRLPWTDHKSSSTSSSSRLANDLELSSAGDEFDGHLHEGESLDDSSSEQSSSSTSGSNHRESRVCDCCYCEVFGRNSTSLEPRSKGYLEMRERLRLELQRRKEEGLLPLKPGEVMVPAEEPPAAAPPSPAYDIDELVRYINGSAQELPKTSKKSKKKKKVPPPPASPNCDNRNGQQPLQPSPIQKKKQPDLSSLSLDNRPVTKSSAEKQPQPQLLNGKQNGKCNSQPTPPPPTTTNHSKQPTNETNNKKKPATTTNAQAKNNNNNNKKGKQQAEAKPSPSKKQQSNGKESTGKKTVLPDYLIGPDSPISITLVEDEEKTMVNIKNKAFPSASSSPPPPPQSPSYTSTSDGKNNIITVSLANKLQGTNGGVPPPSKPPITVFVENGKDENGISLKVGAPMNLKLASNNVGKSKKNKKKKNAAEAAAYSPDEVFLPMENIDLENGDLDESDRVIEAFKRFCLDSKPPAHKEKVKFNLTKNLVLPKKKTSDSA